MTDTAPNIGEYEGTIPSYCHRLQESIAALIAICAT
jgi:hypothetical protein